MGCGAGRSKVLLLGEGGGGGLLKRFGDPPAKHRNFCKNRTFRESV